MDAHTSPVTTSASPALTFPAGFRWGVATSSYQFEGNCANSQWYAWEKAGHSKSGDVAGDACD
jgi:beta-glucosidase/6-phospho-beta-glucosidase/beta-galactosidase